jgi:hypothetical protein
MTKHSPVPFITEYSPFENQRGEEIPSFRIYDAEGEVVAETDSGKPQETQEADAGLLAAAPELVDVLQAQTEAAQAVIDAWDTGDLAGAVRVLDASIQPARSALSKAKPPSA